MFATDIHIYFFSNNSFTQYLQSHCSKNFTLMKTIYTTYRCEMDTLQ